MIAFLRRHPLPWTVIGFLECPFLALGLALFSPRPAARRGPAGQARRPMIVPLEGRTAIVMPVYDEDPRMVLGQSGGHDRMIWRLPAGWNTWRSSSSSDTQDRFKAADEARAVADFHAPYPFRRSFPLPPPPPTMPGTRPENLWEWLEAARETIYDYMIVLDADSLMSGGRHSPASCGSWIGNPRLGICQTLIAGLPSRVAFTRMFQFGMRHGMRAYYARRNLVAGACRSLFGGHNAIIRVGCLHAPLPPPPPCPATGPLSGLVLSHDQLEAAQDGARRIRGAGCFPLYVVWQLRDQPALPAGIRPSLPCAGVRAICNISSW